MKKFGILLSLLVTATLSTWAQGAKSIRITELMPNNQACIVDEYGAHKAWVELSNTSFTTYNIRGMFLTTVCSTRTCRPRNVANSCLPYPTMSRAQPLLARKA